MECLQELREKIGISAPVLIVTDRKTALMKALDSVFLQRTNLERLELTLLVQWGPNFSTIGLLLWMLEQYTSHLIQILSRGIRNLSVL
jgi:hypothetical protein